MKHRKFKSITVKQRDNKKGYNQLYYQIAVKPFRKTKEKSGVMHLRCPLCSHFINYQKFIARNPNPKMDLKMFWYGGRANIQIQDFSKIEKGIEKYTRETLAHKLKLLLIAFKQEELPQYLYPVTTEMPLEAEKIALEVEYA